MNERAPEYEALQQVVARYHADDPRNLAIGEGAEHLLPEPYVRHATTLPATAGPADLAALSRHDFALVLDAVDGQPEDRLALELLHRLRDLYAARVLVAVDEGSATWPRERFLGLGFTCLGTALDDRAGSEGRPLRLYGYDIATYKHTPDWLNAEHWANPELFGRYRW